VNDTASARFVRATHSKFRAPRSRRALLERPALVARLFAATKEHSVVSIVAPAGYGKTTLLAQLAEKLTPDARVVWVSLEYDDDQPGVFVASLIEATSPLALDWEQDPRGLVRQVTSSGSTGRAAIGALANAFCTTSLNRIVLAIDDAHLIQNADVAVLLEALIERLPEHVSIVLAGRTPPALPLARWLIEGDAAEFGTADLAFDNRDVAALAAILDTSAVDQARVVAVLACTQGWPAGTALMLRGATEPQRATASGRSQALLFDYLANEVLADVPAELREFAEEVSILAELTPELAAAVTQRSDARAMLRWLRKRDLFVTTLDAERPVLKFHDLFRDFLRSRLTTRAPQSVHALHERAARAESDTARALPHWLAAQAWHAAAKLITRDVTSLIARGHRQSIDRWLEQMPDSFVASSAEGLFARALCAWLNWDYVGARAALARSIELEQAAGGAPATFALLVRMGLEIALGDREAATRTDAELAQRQLAADERAAFALQRAWHALGIGAIDRVVREFQVFNELARQAPERICPQVADRVHSAYIGLPGMQREYEHYLLTAGTVPRNAAAAWRVEYLILAGWRELWRGDRAAAEAVVLEARQLQVKRDPATPTEDALIRLEAVFLAATGDVVRAVPLARTLVARFSRPEAASMRIVFERAYWCGVGKVAWMVGDERTLADVATVLARERVPQEWNFIDLVRLVVSGQLAAMHERWGEAIGQLTQAVALHTALRFPQGHGDPRLCLAYVYVVTGRSSQATPLVEEIVAECFADDACGLLVCEPPRVVSRALEALSVSTRRDARWHVIEARLSAWSGGEFRVRASGPLGHLSDREREVLVRVAQGFGNKDIARDLTLSPHTVKRHLANILDKLDCVSRKQAADLFRTQTH
jgi:LuxR family transcriptional regulator, maltose regulon positive regulatory protein